MMNAKRKGVRVQPVLLMGLTAILMSQSVLAHIPGIVRNPKPSTRPVAGPIKPHADILTIDPTDPSSFELLRHEFFGQVVDKGWSTPMGLFPNVETQVIFWGTEWQNSRFDGDRITGLDDFYSGLDGSEYLATLEEYMPPEIRATQGVVPVNGSGEVPYPIPRPSPHINAKRPSMTYEGSIIESSPVPVLGIITDPELKYPEDSDFTTAIHQVCSMISSGKVNPRTDGVLSYFPIYVSSPRPAAVTSCAEHGMAFCEGRTPQQNIYVATALFYNTDNDPLCEVNDARTGHSESLAELANTSARAIVDIYTDAGFGGWYDDVGNEVDDKCDSVFVGKSVELANGTSWKLQALWSNLAVKLGTGAPNVDSMYGCVVAPPSQKPVSGSGGGKGKKLKGS